MKRVFLLFFFAFSWSSGLFAQTANSVPVYESFDELAPIFEFTNDTTYVINFWATWCKPCVDELPYLERLHERFPDEKMRVILVSLDFPRQIESKLLPFIEKHELRSDVVVLTDERYNDWIDRVDEQWDGAIPVSLVYRSSDRKFINRVFHTFEELEVIVENMLTSSN